MQKINIKMRYKNIKNTHSFASPGGGVIYSRISACRVKEG
jgi:hypothetical protein